LTGSRPARSLWPTGSLIGICKGEKASRGSSLQLGCTARVIDSVLVHLVHRTFVHCKALVDSVPDQGQFASHSIWVRRLACGSQLRVELPALVPS